MWDLTEVKEGSFELLPNGTYYVIMDQAEVKDTKSGTGSYINAKLKILEGPHEGRFIFTTFNIKNDNAKATEIGLAQLKGFMRCSGVTDFKLANVLDLIGLRCDAVIKSKDDEHYRAKNVVSYYRPHETKTNKESTPF